MARADIRGFVLRLLRHCQNRGMTIPDENIIPPVTYLQGDNFPAQVEAAMKQYVHLGGLRAGRVLATVASGKMGNKMHGTRL